MNQAQRDEEKAAALDAALDYEDRATAWVRREKRSVGSVGSDGSKDQRKKGQAMLDRDKLRELDEACGELAAAEQKVRRICAEIAGAVPAVPVAEAAAAVRAPSGPRPARAGGRRGKSSGGHRAPHFPKEKGQLDKPWQKVCCSECGAITGSRIVADVRKPAGHFRPGTQAACAGREKAAPLATAEQMAAALAEE